MIFYLFLIAIHRFTAFTFYNLLSSKLIEKDEWTAEDTAVIFLLDHFLQFKHIRMISQFSESLYFPEIVHLLQTTKNYKF